MAARTHPSELADARRFVGDDELDDYVRRSRDARLRVSLLEAFYTRFPCRMSALHLLGAGGIAIARFAAVSEVYGEIGDRLLPIDRQGQPRTERWREYVRAFELGQPADLLEEHWLRAHLEDMEAVKAQGWGDDGSLHFVREFWCADEVRVFDSDFVVRQVDGRPTLLEVFGDLKLAAQMHTEVLDDGGIAMTIRRLFVRGIPIGVGPVRVCFETRPDGDALDVEGVMDVGDGGGLMGWFLRRLLPRRVGAIRYRALPVASATS